LGIKWPRVPGGKVAASFDEERFRSIVDIELHHVRRPDHSVGMESGACLLACGKCVRSADSVARRNSGVNRGFVAVGTRPVKNLRGPVLHKICFSAVWPRSARGDAASERPKGRPKTRIRCVGQLEARFDPAVLKVFYAFRVHAGRDPLATIVYRLNHKVPAAIDVDSVSGRAECTGALRRVACVSRRPAVDFNLLVAPAIVISQVKLPHLGVWRSLRAGKFLAPLSCPRHRPRGTGGNSCATLRTGTLRTSQRQECDHEKEAASPNETRIYSGDHRCSFPFPEYRFSTPVTYTNAGQVLSSAWSSVSRKNRDACESGIGN
jgi:hypothetical protein